MISNLYPKFVYAYSMHLINIHEMNEYELRCQSVNRLSV